MENGHPTIGLKDKSLFVEPSYVEHKGRHGKMDSVMCYDEKIPENTMGMGDTSRGFGVSNTGLAREREDILSRDVLDSVSSEVGVGYLRLQNDFCSMEGDYLLGYTGVGFSEGITNLEYDSNEGLLTSVSDCSVLASNSSPWKADIFRIMDTPEFGEVPSLCHDPNTLDEDKCPKSPISRGLQDIDKFHDISSCSFQDILSDGNDTGLSPPVKMFHNPKDKKNDESGPKHQNGGPNRIEPIPAHAKCSSDLPTQKRLRKPTRRYIDELMHPISRYSKRRREVSCLTVKDKSVGAKDQKKCRIGSRAMALPAEESSVVAIQVPFGSLVHKEYPKNPPCEKVCSSDRGSNPVIKSEDYRVTAQNQKRREESTLAVHPKKKDHHNLTAQNQKRRDECTLVKKDYHNLTAPCQKKSDHIVTATFVKKGDENPTAPSPKKKSNDCVLAVVPYKTDYSMETGVEKESDDDYCFTEESSEEGSVRRKHHRVWTIPEVKKLIDGVSEYGVGRWSRIKKLSFSASAHRTSVDLKDKWRNLLKASRMQLGNHQGENKRNVAWRPLPKSILRRVCELANMHPYPRGRKHNSEIAQIEDGSLDRGADITLSDYRRILRSISGN